MCVAVPECGGIYDPGSPSPEQLAERPVGVTKTQSSDLGQCPDGIRGKTSWAGAGKPVDGFKMLTEINVEDRVQKVLGSE